MTILLSQYLMLKDRSPASGIFMMKGFMLLMMMVRVY